MEIKLKISKVILFECETIKEGKKLINSPRLVGDKIFDLSQDGKYEDLKSSLEFNIKRKIQTHYSEDFSKIDKKDSIGEELFPEMSRKGRKAISIIFNLKEKPEDSVLETLLQSKQNFRFECAKFANKYMELKKEIRGILGIIKFELISNKQVIPFLSIITADFNESIITDDIKAIRFLNKAFDKSFKTIIIYPFLSGKKGKLFLVDNKKAKTHQKITLADPDIFNVAELDPPDFPQKILEGYYKKGISLKEIYDKLGEDYITKANVIIEFGDSKFKIPFKDFINLVELIYEEKGQGLFIKNKEINVKIGKSNLFNDQKIKRLSLDELSKKLK